MPSTKPRLFINGYGVADVAYEDPNVNMGTAVDLAGYTSGSPYTTPSDGYATAFVSGSGTSYLYVGQGMLLATNNSDIVSAVYVKKGQKLWCSLSGGGKAQFKPFVE